MSQIAPLQYTIRLARRTDIPAIRSMQERSMRILGGRFYTAGEIAGFLAEFGTMDDTIVDEGHFFVAEDHHGAILASAGWSRAKPRYASGLDDGGSAAEHPTVRSVFVDPAVVRRGIGSAIMRRTEYDAAKHGLDTLRLTATLSGVALYESLGYRSDNAMELKLPNQLRFACVKMAKQLPKQGSLAA